jgi:WD40 repeat protein
VLAVAAALAVVASGLAAFGFHASAEANDRAAEATLARDQAQSREIAIEADRLRPTDPGRAAQLALIADQNSPTQDARSARVDSTAVTTPTRLPAQQGPTFIARDPTRDVIAVTNADDGSVSLWSTSDPHKPALLATAASALPRHQQFSVAISPDGHQLAAGDDSGLIQRWDISDPARPVPLPGPGSAFPSGVLGLAYSPDGRTLVAGGAGGEIQRWDVSDLRAATALPGISAGDLVSALTWSPDGDTLWAGDSAGEVEGWMVTKGAEAADDADAATGTDATRTAGGDARTGAGDGAPARPLLLTGGSTQVNTIALSPDGTILAAGDKAGQVMIWRRGAVSGWTEDEPSLADFGGWTSTMAFNSDGSLLAVGSTDNTVRVLKTSDWSTVAQLTHPGPVTAVAFHDDGTLVTASTDGYVRIWPVPGPVIGPVGASVFGVDLVAGRRLLVAPGPAVNALLPFGVGDPMRPTRWAPSPPGDTDIALDGALDVTADGRLAAIGSRDGKVQLWDLADQSHPVALGKPFQAADKLIEQLGFSSDGRLLAVGSDASVVDLWDVSDPQAPRHLATTTPIGGLAYSVAFQPGGSLLAAATTGGNVRVWDVADAQHPHQVADLTGLEGYALTTAFSPDGSMIAAAGAGREVRLWIMADPAHPALIGAPLTGPTNNINMIGFSADGTRLAAVTSDGVLWLWDMHDPSSPILLGHMHAGDGILFALSWSPDGQRVAAAGSAQSVWTWTTDPTLAAKQLCAAQGTGITAHEWALYVQDRAYRPPCDQR